MRARKGFTLIELVVVIAILGILAGIAIPRFMDSIETARGAKLLADLRSIESAGTVYYTKNGKYPLVTTDYQHKKDSPDFIKEYFGSWPLSTGGYAIVQGYNGVNYRYNLSNGSIPYEYAYNSQEKYKSYEGRATIDQKTLEHYLGGEAGRGHGPVAIVSAESIDRNTSDQIKEKLKLALSELGADKIGEIDSTSTNGEKTKFIIDFLSKNGINLVTCDWAVRGSSNDYRIYIFPKLTGTGKVNATVYNIKDNNVTSSSQIFVNVKNDNGTLKIDK